MRGLLLVLLASTSLAWGYETDPYSERLHPVADAIPVLDNLVNRALQEVAQGWAGPRNDLRLARAVYKKLGGHYWVDRLERITIEHAQVQRLPRGLDNLYADASLLAGRVIVVVGLGPTLQLNNILVGSDKFGHFFSQGFKYYRRYLQSGQYESATLLEYGARVERRFFGALTTGIYSNADLVANYEGMRFYLSLSRATDRPALFAWHDDRPVLQRRFSWQHFVNEYWDEAINASLLNPDLAVYLDARLPRFCQQYHSMPERFEAQDDARLLARYSRIGIKNNHAYRISNHCQRAK